MYTSLVGLHHEWFGADLGYQLGRPELPSDSSESFTPFVTMVFIVVPCKNASDVWYFPPGVPHSIQATSNNPQGTEFLLVGDFIQI